MSESFSNFSTVHIFLKEVFSNQGIGTVNITKCALMVKNEADELYTSHPMLKPQSTEILMEKILGNRDLMRLLRLNEKRKQ